MRFRKYASAKVVVILATTLLIFGGMMFQHKKIVDLKNQVTTQKTTIEQLTNRTNTFIDLKSIETKLNVQCEFKITDGKVNIKHSYEYTRDGILGINHTNKIVGTADLYYQLTTNLRYAKVLYADYNQINVMVELPEVNDKACHRIVGSFRRMDDECSQSILSNRVDAQTALNHWEDTFDLKGIEKIKEYYAYSDIKQNLIKQTEEQIKVLFAELGYSQDIKVTVTDRVCTTIETIKLEGEDENMKMVILDAGHNEYVSGKEAPDKSMREWEFNNDMQYRINKLLCEYPEFYVYMTNPEPAKKNEIGLTKRATLANTQWKMKGKPDAIFISLHANAYGVWTNANGCETFHAKNASTKSKTFAKIVNDEIHVTLKALNPQSINRGVKCANHAVTKNAAMPAVLIEYGFYTNKTDLAILKNNRQELAEATVKAICEYFKIEYQKDIPVVNNKDFLVKIIYSGGDGLNVRQEPNTLSKINAKVYQNQVFTMVEEKNGWGKLKSGVGWISLNTKYVQKL